MPSKVHKFYELLKESVIAQFYITVALISTACYLWATGQVVPETLKMVMFVVIGFFFGTKMLNVVVKGMRQ